jgi:hypothetical protein
MSDRQEKTDQLWRAFRRDLSASILELAGARRGNALGRLHKTWERLCDTNLDAATAIYHGIKEIEDLTARYGEPNSPADHRLRQMGELTGMIAIAAASNPGIKAWTVGELLALGEEEIRRQVDDDT